MTPEIAAKGAAVDAAKELVLNTPESHPDHKTLMETITVMTEVARETNSSTSVLELRLALFRLSKAQTSFSLFKEKALNGKSSLVKAHRVFLLKGALAKVGRKAPKERYFVLFNDLLIYG